MPLDIYLLKLYLILTFTKQYKQEVDGGHSLCIVDREHSIP